VLVDEQAGPAEELLTYADLAMFDAKRDGRDRVGFHEAP
jgi:GGDEF domain-containing protein